MSYTQSTGLQRVGHDQSHAHTRTHMPVCTCTHTHTHTMAKMLDIISDQENTNQDLNEIPFHTHENLCVCVSVCMCTRGMFSHV